jgi:hypothetical protein
MAVMLAALGRWLRTALYVGVGFTGLGVVWSAFARHDPNGVALYGVLCLLFVAGLGFKSANNRTT